MPIALGTQAVTVGHGMHVNANAHERTGAVLGAASQFAGMMATFIHQRSDRKALEWASTIRSTGEAPEYPSLPLPPRPGVHCLNSTSVAVSVVFLISLLLAQPILLRSEQAGFISHAPRWCMANNGDTRTPSLELLPSCIHGIEMELASILVTHRDRDRPSVCAL